MNNSEKDFVFSESVKAGKRIYYFDVKQSRNGEKYISITESKKIVEEGAEFPRVIFEKHKIFLYKEDYDKFTEALMKALAIAKGEQPVASDVAAEPSPVLGSEDIKIDLDF